MLWFLQITFLSTLFFITEIICGNECIALPVRSFKNHTFTDSSQKLFLNLSSDRIVTTDSSTCIIPFSRAGNLILIKGRADTTEGNFILDTGAPHLVLNITYFRNYPSTVIADAEQAGITGAVTSVTRTR